MVIAVRRDRYDSDFKSLPGGGRALRPQGGVFCIASSGHGLLELFGLDEQQPLVDTRTSGEKVLENLQVVLSTAMVFGWY